MIQRTTTLILFICLAFAAVATGQNSVKTGVKGGINFATFTGADATYDSRTGFVIGGFAKFSLPDTPYSIQPEIHYSQRGAVDDGNEIRIDYLDVPVLLKYSFSQGGSVQPNLFAGPYASMRLSAEQEGGAGGLFGGSSNIESQTESVDYGALIGAGFDVEVGTSIFTVDARYGFGLADVFRNESGKNRLFSVTIGISLPEM